MISYHIFSFLRCNAEKQTTLKGRGFATGETFSIPIVKSITNNSSGPGTTSALRTLGWNGKMVWLRSSIPMK